MIRAYNRDTDEPLLRQAIIELQETQRALDGRLPAGASMASAYAQIILQRCADWDGCVFVACDESHNPLGMVCIFAHVPSTEVDEPSGTYGLLNDLVILPHGRRRGAGRALLEAAESFARARGAEVLRLEVMAGNTAAMSLYKEAGYRARLFQMEKRLRRKRRKRLHRCQSTNSLSWMGN